MGRINRRDFVKSSIMLAAIGKFAAQRRIKAAANNRPNILWIMMDDCRADALGCYGRPWAKTPNMDAIAARGVRFDKAIVQNPVCVPSRKSMKSGQYAHRCGVTAMGRPPEVRPAYMDKADPDMPNLLNKWKEIGIRPVNAGKTHAYRKDWVSKGDRPPHWNVCGKPVTEPAKKRMTETGSKYPHAITKTHKWAIGGTIPYKPEETSIWEMGDLALESLKELTSQDQPFFLRVSFHAPHVACRVPESYLVDPDTIKLPLPTDEELKSKPEFERDNLHIYAGAPQLSKEQIGIARGTYYGMVAMVDEQVGRIVDCLKKAGKLDNTIIAINSDQGFQLGEHGLWKKRVFYEQNVCVPFVLSCPSLLPQNKVVEEPVEMIDFIPTLMEMSGIKADNSIAGRSLMTLIHGKVKRWRRACFSEIDHSMSMYRELRQNSGRRVMVRTKRWKLVYFMDERVKDKDGVLYDLKKDPGETKNLYNDAKYARAVKRLERLAQKWNQNS